MTGSIQFLRIDDRLIHGQVIVGWLPTLGSTHILVVNDRIAADGMRQEMMGLSVPQTVTLQFCSTGDAAAFRAVVPETLALVASPRDAWLCLQAGLAPAVVNIGGLHARAGKAELREALHLDEDDRKHFDLILKSGVMPVFQPTPQNEPLPLGEIL
ncbi:MAG TPA: PTS sugar transporter subunit IIB [Candidatus Ozemobacteraceae bacterium]|nr:PTS sugar transporter subunit IIB [Candidatus Ozemobacteraceae bacterium]